MMPQGPGSNMNVGTPCCAVYPVVCFDCSHISTVFLIKLRACVCMFPSLAFSITSVSFSMGQCPGERLYVLSYPRTRRTFFFSQTHYIEWYNFQTQLGCISSWWWNESFLTMTFRSRFAVPPGNIGPVHPGQIPLLHPWKYSTSPVLPISPECLQGLGYISQTPCPNLNYVYYNSTVVWGCFQNQYLIGSVKGMKVEWPSALPQGGWLTCSIWCLRFEGLLPFFAWGGQMQLWV